MPHPAQQAQRGVPSAVEKRQNNGHRSANGHSRSNGHAPTVDQDQSVPIGTEMHVVDVAALIAENDGLRERLASQPVIEQAKGILMGHYGISSDMAFQLLCRWSQDTNSKLRRIAELLTDTTTAATGSRPAPHQIVQRDFPSTLRRPGPTPARPGGTGVSQVQPG